MEHEAWHSALMHYHTRRCGYLGSWVEHRRGLLQKVAAIFKESQRVFGARQQAREEREQQKKICKELHAKVSPLVVVFIMVKWNLSSLIGRTVIVQRTFIYPDHCTEM